MYFHFRAEHCKRYWLYRRIVQIRVAQNKLFYKKFCGSISIYPRGRARGYKKLLFLHRPVTRLLITHLSLYTRLKPTCNKKIGIMGLVYIFNQWGLNCRARREVPSSNPSGPLIFKLFVIFQLKQKNDRNINKNLCENHNNW